MSNNDSKWNSRKLLAWIVGSGLVVVLALVEAFVRLWKPQFTIPVWCPTTIVTLVGIYIAGNAGTHWAYGRNGKTKPPSQEGKPGQ